ncbi:flagellar M-ring protein FliF [Shewanella sp. A25]|nr:flagellar M-ring protein FliF [Shewanella shenzhenensis]
MVATKNATGALSQSPGLKEKVVNMSDRINWPQRGDRSLASIALLATLVAAVIVIILWTSAKDYVPLYGNQEHYDKANILDVLDKEEIPFRIDNDSGNIMVPQDKLADARITLAARGVKAALPDGLNTVGEKIPVGSSQFMETKQYQHALEGELARTVMKMEGIQNARVHLALPKRSLFIGRKEERASASVMVELTSGYELKQQQVESIVSLVSGSIPGLDPRAVSVVDQRGRLATAELFDDSPVGKDSSKKLQFISSLEQKIEQRAAIMLVPIVGNDNYRIQVSTDVDFSVMEETKETLDPNTIIVSESTKSGSTSDQLAIGIPGSLANQPPEVTNNEPNANEANTGNTNQNDKNRTNERNESLRKFEAGRSVTHTQHEVGRIKSMSVSVLLNNKAATDGVWTEERLSEIGDMVRTATGFNMARGDKFSITSFNFVDNTIVAEIEALPWWQQSMVLDHVRYAVGALIALLLILFGVRPLVNHLIHGKRHEPQKPDMANRADEGDELNVIDSVHVTNHSASAQAATTTSQEADNSQKRATHHLDDEDNMIHMALPKAGAVFEEQLTHMQFLANKESERVTAVIKSWVERGIDLEFRKP